MFVTRKSLPRRAVLRAVGVSLGLPMLESMHPALTSARSLSALTPTRFGVFYVPMGMNMAQWTPSSEGALEATPILAPLAAHRERLLVLSGLDCEPAVPGAEDGGGQHSRVQGSYLTGVHIKKADGPGFRAGVSMDQIAAAAMGATSRVPSLELGLESTELIGGCENGYTCAYTATLSWRAPTVPLPVEVNPGALFERLFGDGITTDPQARRARRADEQSILDSLVDAVARFKKELPANDRLRMDEYTSAVRDVERRVQQAESDQRAELPVIARPVGTPASFEEHGAVMCDLLALAWQGDITRVSTFLIARELSARTYPEIGIADNHHPLSHHQNLPEQLAKQGKLNLFHMNMFSRFVDRLATTQDGDGSLLDHSLILYGSGMSDSNLHLPKNLPTMLVGGAQLVKGGRHLRYPAGTPLSNLHLALLDRVGVPVDSFGDATGRLNLLSDV